MNEDRDRQVSFEEMEHRATAAKKKLEDRFAQIMNAALEALSRRAFLFLALVATIGMFAGALIVDSWPAATVAVLFSLLVYWPSIYAYRKEGGDDGN